MLKRKNLNKILFLLIIIFVSSCSMQKNTWFSRNYHAMTAYFNIYFNGLESYNEGLKNILVAHQDDYSTILPMFPISKHSNASAATANMDRAIEKSRKAIKLHSIKQKPEKNYNKWNSAEYQAFYNQEEFNPVLKDAWMLIGKAEFHKGDFLGSAGTFSYIARHFASDPDLVAQAKIWLARAYGEMGWLYEAQQVLGDVNQDHLKRQHIGLFASVNADILLKNHQYKEAIPFLRVAIDKETDKKLKQRFLFILAQLYQKTGDEKAAYETYTKVLQSNPPFEMDFYARIQRSELKAANHAEVQKDLNKMLKSSKYKDYQDQIYYVLGKNFLHGGDTAQAINAFRSSIEKSTRNGYDKANSLITLGDLFYHQKNYKEAYPCYDAASKIIAEEHPDYRRISKLADILSEFVTQYDIVMLQDSLQRLAAMPEKQRMEVIQKIISQVEKEEKAAAKKAEEELLGLNYPNNDDEETLIPIGAQMGNSNDWYFYNQNLMKVGKSEFQKKWGNRKLEDNWRRANKSASLFAEEPNAENVSSEMMMDSTSSTLAITDNKNPAFYLKQIPLTPLQLKISNEQMAQAMFNVGKIYYEKIQDIPSAIRTFEEFVGRFPDHKLVPDAYFQLYLMESKLGNLANAEKWRNRLVSEFPQTDYSKMLSKPDYIQRLQRMYQEQDSIYSATYRAYSSNDFATVFRNFQYMQENYPLSELMPKFQFLYALSVGKTQESQSFEKELDLLVTKYPESDVSTMAKDILALMRQGMVAKSGTTHGSLLAKREEAEKSEISPSAQQQFSTDTKTKHRLLLITDAPREELNKLMYQIASFNFSRFLIKDFDLGIQPLDSVRNILYVDNFDSYDEVVWYENTMASDIYLTELLSRLKVQELIISEENFALLKNGLSLADYMAFHDKFLGKNAGSASKQISALPEKEKKSESPKTIAATANKPNSVTETKKTVSTSTEKTPLVASTQPAEQTPNVASVAEQPMKNEPVEKVEVKKEEEVPLFKNLFAYKPNDPHFIAVYVVSGTVDVAKTKAAFDEYNRQNYDVLQLNVRFENVGKQQFFIIGSFTDANTAKSYLLRMVKESKLFEGLKGASYRNLVGTQQNLNVMVQQNALNVYFEFMKQYYLN
ncbi:MAG: tetratricopeptide repeat protein [Bacteroidetes bacterium ADurb.BinA395]|nr:MAG: tetratricopeptide repeat protein [Bacteroidetes bacterium ADurb.BinA395]